MAVQEIDMAGFSVKLQEVVNEFNLTPIGGFNDVDDILVTTSEVNRPGLQIAGFMEHFSNERIQIMGMTEIAFLTHLSFEERCSRLEGLFSRGFPCMVVARRLEVLPEMLRIADKHRVPVYSTGEMTSTFISGLIRYLNVMLAPRVPMHGVLIEVYGVGVLILGESAVGKSETALEIVKRGHRLIADDLVEVRKVSDTTLLGTAPDAIRHFIEIRGIGLLDVKNLYGVGSVKMQENINLVIHLEHWDQNKNYERVGIHDETTNILGIEVPSLVIPVKPGRNLAIIVEVAAMNCRQRSMGYNAAQALVSRTMGEKSAMSAEDESSVGNKTPRRNRESLFSL